MFFAIRLRSFSGDPAEENKIWDKQNETFAETEELTKSIWIVRVLFYGQYFDVYQQHKGIPLIWLKFLCFCGY